MYFVLKLHFKRYGLYCGSVVIILPDEDAAFKTYTSASRFYLKRRYPYDKKAPKISKRLTKRFLDNLFCISIDNINNWILNDNKSIAPDFNRRDTIENVIEHLKKRFKENNYEIFIDCAYTVR